MTVRFSNQQARHIFLERQGLCAPPGKRLSRPDLLRMIHDLGFVQVDSIGTVERAHHQILFSRNQTYRREDLTGLLEEERSLFENWTHDASIIPSAFYPYWKHRFRREEVAIAERWRKWRGEDFDMGSDAVLDRVASGGAVMSRDMKEEGHQSGGWWNWHPNKTALEYLWRTGRLAISGRINFQKVYDLGERVLPALHHAAEVSHEEFVDFACRGALQRLGFATAGEIAAFFALVSPVEVRQWLASHDDELRTVMVEAADGGAPRSCFALAENMPDPGLLSGLPERVRVLSPFDPLIRDRNRTERLFGFFYRIEVFVPEAKRQYGYYVFPLLEADRLIGRIDMKANRSGNTLDVRRLWLEPGVRASRGRLARLEAELSRLARFTGVERVMFLDGWNTAQV